MFTSICLLSRDRSRGGWNEYANLHRVYDVTAQLLYWYAESAKQDQII